MRSFCWVYYRIKTNQVVLVLKPHRRAFDPTYLTFCKDGETLHYSRVKAWDFRKKYAYVGRMK